MHIALVKDGEPFPAACRPYPLRVGNLAAELSERGHRVVWHASDFLHYKHEHVTAEGATSEGDEFRIQLYSVGGYARNLSFARWVHHCRLAWAEFRALMSQPKLDLIFCCVPTLESALACVLVSRLRKVPLVLDIRDPWPEAFALAAPVALRPVVRAVLFPYFKLASWLFRNSTHLTAVSKSFLEWAQVCSGRSLERRSEDRVFYHGCHDLQRSRPARVGQGPLRVLYLGGFSTIYEFETLKSSLQNGLGDAPWVEFVLVGEGGDGYETLKQQLQRYSNVHMPGWLPREEAYRLASTCHIGLIPLKASHRGFLPNKPFEYASLGLAILTSAEGEVRELVASNHCGWSYGEGDSHSFQATLKGLKDEPSHLQRFRNNARKFWQSQGDSRVIARCLADHVLSLTESGTKVVEDTQD